MKDIFKDKKASIILLLLLIMGAIAYFSGSHFRPVVQNVAVNLPANQDDSLRDSIAANRVDKGGAPDLALPADEQTGLKDSVAQNPADPGQGVGGHGPSNPGSPRGGTNGGTNPGQGVGNDFGHNGHHNDTPTVSPSGPQQLD